MKFLPLRYRERMSEFFGKRGKSWHVSAVITRRIAGELNVLYIYLSHVLKTVLLWHQ